MRVTVVSRKDLDMKDWRAEHYMPPTKQELCEAAVAGWDNGASGHGVNPESQWLRHGRKEIHRAYLEGRSEGVRARAAYFVTLGGGG